MSLEQIIDESEVIASGQVVKSWSGWDRSHQFIWTHYELAVHDVTRGARVQRLVVSEPGGAADGLTQYIPGTPTFQSGEEVTVFLYRTPIGYMRTVGWGQGKFTITPEQKIYSDSAHMNGVSVREFKARVLGMAQSRKTKVQ